MARPRSGLGRGGGGRDSVKERFGPRGRGLRSRPRWVVPTPHSSALLSSEPLASLLSFTAGFKTAVPFSGDNRFRRLRNPSPSIRAALSVFQTYIMSIKLK